MQPTLAPRRGLRRRFVAAFAVLVGIVVLSAGLSLATHLEVHDQLEDVARSEKAIEDALRLSAAVRDAYAHQAHTIILNDRTHLHHYAHARQAVREALSAARKHARDDGDRETLESIERVAAEMHENFQSAILPGVPGDREALVRPHDRALALVDRIVALTDRLTARFEHRVTAARARADAAHHAEVPRSALLILLAVGVAVGVGVFLDRAIAGPVRSLAEGARRLGHGELQTRIPVDRDDELGAVASRFNEMAAELARRQEELVRTEKLASVGRLAAGVAHELNNPLGVIYGYAKLLARGPEPAARDARLIAEEVERCREIVSGLLDLSRPPRLSRGPVDLGELVREVAERLGESGPALRLALTDRAPEPVEADGPKLRQIVWNLLRNAAEARPDGTVRVEIMRSGGELRLSIEDEGPGVSAEARARLFEPFFTTKPRGTGLGLAVSAALARAHGGELALVEGGVGARFELRLPLHASGAEAAA